MDWFYAAKDERKGPVSERELTGLIAKGQITRDTLVWNQTMADWKIAGATPLFSSSTQPPPQIPALPDHHLCIITGKQFHVSQMLKTEHGWVSAEGKDTYYQSIREGAPIPMAEGQTNARADGNKIVVPLSGGKLPQRCVKTNQPVSEADVKRKTFYGCTPYIYFALLINLLVVIILYYVLRKRIMLDLPLSRDGKSLVTKNKLIAWGIFIAGLVTMFWGFASLDEYSFAPLAAFLGILILLGALIFGALKAHALRVVKIKGDNAWLAGAHKDFVASLPRYP